MHVPERDEQIQDLFAPVDVRAFTAAVDAALIAELRAEEAAATAPMAHARQAEFATARACARAALADLGVDASVPRQDGGAPQWPSGLTGSISHTRGYCVAVASQDHAAIGIDVELVARMKPAVERRILIDAEHAVVHELAAEDRRRAVATIFAAKEAFYKAHYDLDPRYLGFDAVHVTIDSRNVTFAPASGAVDPALLSATQGRCRIANGRVIVGVTINATAPSSALPSPA